MPSTTQTAFPTEVAKLVERFSDNFKQYKSPSYNETQVRREFVDPFFKSLGWDVDNAEGYAEAYKDVVHEDSIRIQGSAKAPDYGFRIGGTRKFFVETKKPHVNLNVQPEAAYQLRRYAWSAKLPLSILTDFEEFAVYDTRIKPLPSDKASKARILYLKYTDYEARWSEIRDVFHKESIRKGAFDRYAESNRKRGTEEMDEAFLDTIRQWREDLAKDIHKHNELSERHLNHSVQALIDRIIFLRICEDRGTEEFGRLLKLRNDADLYPALVELFHAADERYNSGLFHFKPERSRASEPDTLATGLRVSGRILKRIIGDLYYPSQYEFRVFPLDVLGQVYERFLGDVITLSKTGKTVTIEPKPEVRKAGGVYYTPTYIVDYIVGHTVGELVKGKQPHEVAGRTEKTFKPSKGAHPIRVLDPACGSGSFLLGAYQFMLNWYRDQYALAPERWLRGAEPTIWQAGERDYRLTISERKRILLDHVFGVDIDRQAVEVSKLSLLLKCLEGENSDTIGAHLFHMKERALPDLGANIRCGNSLIAPDFYDGKDPDSFTTEDRLRINAFDWKKEFKGVFKDGGFDAVIGNPPYVLLQHEFRDDIQLDYYRNRYTTASYKLDTYHLFIERAIRLLSPIGRASMITPSNYWTNNHLSSLRLSMLDDACLESLINIGPGVFPRISVDTGIFVLSKQVLAGHDIDVFNATLDHSGMNITLQGTMIAQSIRERDLHLFTGAGDGKLEPIWTRIMDEFDKIDDIAYVNFGKQLRNRRTFTTDVIQVDSVSDIPQSHRPCWTGKDAKRYLLKWSNHACMDSEEAQRGGCWQQHRHEATPKLLTPQVGTYPVFALDVSRWHCLNTMFMISAKNNDIDAYALLAILNSTLIRCLWVDRFYDQRRTFPKIKGSYLKQLPIPDISRSPLASTLASMSNRLMDNVQKLGRV